MIFKLNFVSHIPRIPYFKGRFRIAPDYPGDHDTGSFGAYLGALMEYGADGVFTDNPSFAADCESKTCQRPQIIVSSIPPEDD